MICAISCHFSLSRPQLYHPLRTWSKVIPLYLTMAWSSVYTEYSKHRVQHAPSAVYTEYSIHQVQHTPSTAYTQYRIYRAQHTPSTAYTQYSNYQVQHTPSTANTEYSITLELHTPHTALFHDRLSATSSQSLISWLIMLDSIPNIPTITS